ncbi:MAG: hypothetical protein NTZ33_06745 [Bacteroidetes bacterium]|nr:hypothetical protein [Bacteroidota bacterium]
MNRFKIIILLFSFSCLFSCETPVTFSEPQPVGISNLSGFPKLIQGQYISFTDNSILSISENLMLRIYDFDEKIHKNQLDSTSRLIGNTIVDLTTNEKTHIKHEGDSLISHIHYIDTLFQIDNENVVKKFKGYYFLNKFYGNTSWEVKKLELSKGKLIISRISTKIEIENLKTITESSQDTIAPYKFTITKKQFKKFIKSDGFSDSEVFIKQK